jgi:alpha,alpha-trehalase
MCLPNYDGEPVFGALFDAQKGGFWRIAPLHRRYGQQSYVDGTAILRTAWEEPEGCIEIADCMLWPAKDRRLDDVARRVLLRRVRCSRGKVRCQTQLYASNYEQVFLPKPVANGWELRSGTKWLGLWTSRLLEQSGEGLGIYFELLDREEVWFVLGPEEIPAHWSEDKARLAFDACTHYWRDWSARVSFNGARAQSIRRSAVLTHLLEFAPTGAMVAAPTTSLPERIGGGRNYDYRFAWLRDASLAISFLADLGLHQDARSYLEWVAGLDPGSKSGMPYQVLYRVDGSRDVSASRRKDLNGYRASRPVVFGNRAARMIEIDSFGYLMHCMHRYLETGGQWSDDYWKLARRVADFTAANWHRKGASIWELLPPQHFVIGKIMSWVTLDRALRIAAKYDHQGPHCSAWQKAKEEIFSEVTTRGWSKKLNSFRQRYGSDTVDAALLLIPLMGFLPADDPRVRGTVECISFQLEVNGFVHRFVPELVPKQGELVLGEAEGAFLMCTFWLVQVYVQLGELERAEDILRRAEDIAGALGLYAEAVDARNNAWLGNTPLLFSQIEYARAAMALSRARVSKM